MAKENLVAFHMERQDSKCAICGTDLTELERWAIRVDRYPKRGEDGGAYTEDNTRLICLECDWELEGNKPNSPRPRLRAAYDRYKMHNQLAGDFLRRIKAMSGQLANTTRAPYKDPSELLDPYDFFVEQEKESKKDLEILVRAQPEWEGFFKDAPYVKELTAAFLLSHIDINKATTPSKIWRYLGLDPTEKYNPGKGKMRAPLYAALSIALIRKDGPYRPKYDEYKERGVSHGGAIRRLIKLWLSHLYETWRQFAGLYVRPPYDHRDGTECVTATEFGWPKIE